MAVRKSQTRVLIVDDHPVLRSGISQIINQEQDMTVCGEVSDGKKTIQTIAQVKPDVVILDISLNGVSGIEVLKDIKTHYPKLHVLILSMHDEAIYAPRALRAGAAGYIMKDEAVEKVLLALRKILNGEVYLSERMSAKLLSRFAAGGEAAISSPIDLLSDRELEVFNLIGQGCGTRMIAEKLNLSVKTIESHRAHIKEKLNLGSATELVHQAIQWAQSEKLVAN